MIENDVSALVLAAGKGTRMHTDRPKVLLELLETPMLAFVFGSLQSVVEHVFTVVGHQAPLVEATFPHHAKDFILQEEQLGTGHALSVAWKELKGKTGPLLLVINGDTPLVRSEILNGFVDQVLEMEADIAFISTTLEDPGSFGRVVRADDGQEQVRAIIEAKDYDEDVHGPETGEINTGIYLLNMESIEPLLDRLGNDNASGEYYITDLIGLGVEHGLNVIALEFPAGLDLLGVNTPMELISAEESVKEEILHYWLSQGVVIREPSNVRISPMVTLEPGVEICGPCEIYGETTVGSGTRIMSHTWITDSTIGHGAEIRPFSHLEEAQVGDNCWVGPFARLRPGAVMEEGSRVGNFVEIKKSRLGKGVKASHLTYLGDADIGEKTNIGAGTITCNYDGKNKHATTIGKEAFIGSNTALVAPVTIGDNAVVGAGSTITRDVPAGNLGLTREKQRNVPWKRTS